MEQRIRYAPNQNHTHNARTERVGELQQIVADEYDPLLGSPRTWVYWFLHQYPDTYSRSDRDDLMRYAQSAAWQSTHVSA